ncbi:hypothetical protein [Rugamonas apoptosis]|uniref:Uncharacterized protein n=1 Tax=Rugamonas apoptosis TaxID=2758570 RepID=A0A7W2IJY5_9BURK|nr:hypothetical protein [Rugamonas apoptosis]MBA5686761.1 hypothetical protein [Rugamonas apoptosis]
MMDQSPHLRIAIDQAAAGMILADDLLDAHGAVLLPHGATLTDATLASLRRRGVGHCTVEHAACGEDADGAQALSSQAGQAARAALRERQLARLQHLFRHSAGYEANATLLQLLTDYRNRE